ncbi:hypothetical protein L227DRAFT_568867, partial [Lentinus tigrinus ALCF2SS1-6]
TRKRKAQCVEDEGEDADGEDSDPEEPVRKKSRREHNSAGSTSSTRLASLRSQSRSVQPAKVKEKSGGVHQAFIVPYVEIPKVPKGLNWCDTDDEAEVYANTDFANGTSSEDDDSAANHDESLGALVVHPIPIPGNLPSMPPFHKVLQLFSYENLSQALRTYRTFVAKPERDGNAFLEAEGNVDLFIQVFRSDRFSHHFLAALAGLWSAHSVISQKADAFELQLAFYRRRVMLSSAAAWYWLTQYCAARCVKIVDRCTQGAVDEDSPDWLERLCCRVYRDISSRTGSRYQASDFLPHLEDVAGLEAVLPRPRHLRKEQYCDRTCSEVLKMLHLWLGYPNRTEMLAAYFVMYAVAAFQNADVLLLPGVWRTYRSVQASILGT